MHIRFLIYYSHLKDVENDFVKMTKFIRIYLHLSLDDVSRLCDDWGQTSGKDAAWKVNCCILWVHHLHCQTKQNIIKSLSRSEEGFISLIYRYIYPNLQINRFQKKEIT